MSASTACLKLAIAMLAALPLTGRNVELDEVVQVGRIQSAKMLRSLVSLNYGHYHYRMFLGRLGCQ
jgi:hypothetical protein